MGYKIIVVDSAAYSQLVYYTSSFTQFNITKVVVIALFPSLSYYTHILC
jgi:hypothetical protein